MALNAMPDGELPREAWLRKSRVWVDFETWDGVRYLRSNLTCGECKDKDRNMTYCWHNKRQMHDDDCACMAFTPKEER